MTQDEKQPREDIRVTPEMVARIPLLAGMSPEEMSAVAAELYVKRYGRREIVIHKGSGGDSLLFLLAGQLQVIDVTEDGKVVGLRILFPGEFFGEIAVISGHPRSASVVATAPAVVAFMQRATALHLFAHSPTVANQILRHLADKIQKDSRFRSILSINNVSRRVFSLIELLKERKSSGLEVVENAPTHQDIANMINASRETVTRAIAVLMHHGIIQKDMRRIIIRNPAALQKLARQGDS